MALRIPACDSGPDPQELERVLRIETGDLDLEIIPRTDEGDFAGGSIELGDGWCLSDGAPLLVVIVRDREGGGPLEIRAELALSDTPQSERPRAVAIAISELLRVSELGARPLPGESAGSAHGAGTLDRASPETRLPAQDLSAAGALPWHISGFLAVSYRGSAMGSLTGGGISLTSTWARRFRFRLAAEFLGGGFEASLGDVDVWLLGPRFGLEWLALPGRVKLALGPSFDVSLVRARGTQASTAEPQSPVWETTVALVGRGQLEVPLGGAWTLDAGLEVGGTLRSIEWKVLGRPSAELSGLVTSGSLGVGFVF